MDRTLYNGARLLGSGPDLDNIERVDHAPIPMLASMMQRGMQVDLSHFAAMSIELGRDMDRITEEVRKMTGTYVNLGSSQQVSALLFKTLGLKQARLKMTKKGDRESTEYEVLVAIQHSHEAIPKILEYKEIEKLKGTYVDPMPGLAKHIGFGVWRMYPNLNHGRIPSGRYNCKEPNLLAMPTRTSRGREIRNGFITDPGWVFLSVDESQIEPRVGAHNSRDENLMRVYWEGEDLYSDFAISAFSIPDKRYREGDAWKYPGVDKVEHRYPSKTCFLAAIYDVSAIGLLEQMPVVCKNCRRMMIADKKDMLVHDPQACVFTPLWNEDNCQDLLNRFGLRYPGLLQDRKRNHDNVRKHGYTWDMWGRLLHVAAVRSVHPWVVAGALRETGNFPYQAGACGTLKLTMGQVQEDIDEGNLSEVYHPLLPLHDEILGECREDVAEELSAHLCYRFESCCDLTVPIKAGGATAETWGAIEK